MLDTSPARSNRRSVSWTALLLASFGLVLARAQPIEADWKDKKGQRAQREAAREAAREDYRQRAYQDNLHRCLAGIDPCYLEWLSPEQLVEVREKKFERIDAELARIQSERARVEAERARAEAERARVPAKPARRVRPDELGSKSNEVTNANIDDADPLVDPGGRKFGARIEAEGTRRGEGEQPARQSIGMLVGQPLHQCRSGIDARMPPDSVALFYLIAMDAIAGRDRNVSPSLVYLLYHDAAEATTRCSNSLLSLDELKALYYDAMDAISEREREPLRTGAAARCLNCIGYDGPGGPCYSGPGGPMYDGPGGPCYSGPGGPMYDGPGGPMYDGPTGPMYAGPGGAMDDSPGGPMYDGPGGPMYDGPGGPMYAGPGGPCYAGPGGPCDEGLGGACYSGPGGGENCPLHCHLCKHP